MPPVVDVGTVIALAVFCDDPLRQPDGRRRQRVSQINRTAVPRGTLPAPFQSIA